MGSVWGSIDEKVNNLSLSIGLSSLFLWMSFNVNRGSWRPEVHPNPLAILGILLLPISLLSYFDLINKKKRRWVKNSIMVCEESKDTSTTSVDTLQSSLVVHEQKFKKVGIKDEGHVLKIESTSRGRIRGRGGYRGGRNYGRGRLINKKKRRWVKNSIMVCETVLIILIFGMSVLALTIKGDGHALPGKAYKDYDAVSFSPIWFPRYVNTIGDRIYWYKIAYKFIKPKICEDYLHKYGNLNASEIHRINLTPLEAGCCRPPKQCDVVDVPRKKAKSTINIDEESEWDRRNWRMASLRRRGVVDVDVPRKKAKSSITIDEESERDRRMASLFRRGGVVRVDKICPYWSGPEPDGDFCVNCPKCKNAFLVSVKMEWRCMAITNLSILLLLTTVYLIRHQCNVLNHNKMF